MRISYSNELLLHDVWTKYDLKRCSMCPDEIAEEKPSISIIDNNDFLNDTFTGRGATPNFNWMILLHVKHQRIGVQENEVMSIHMSKLPRLCHEY